MLSLFIEMGIVRCHFAMFVHSSNKLQYYPVFVYAYTTHGIRDVHVWYRYSYNLRENSISTIYLVVFQAILNGAENVSVQTERQSQQPATQNTQAG